MPTRPRRGLTRRQLLKTSALAATGAFLPGLIRVGAAQAANARLNIAFVGAGGRPRLLMGSCAAADRIVALCDVDDRRAAQAYKKYPDAKRFKDYRVMLDKMGDAIDAVVVGTPDHTHCPIALAAMERGKHVLVEKPLARTVWEVRRMRDAARKHKVVTQMGNQGHAFDGIRLIKAWYEAGVLGEVRRVVCWTNRPNPQHFDLSHDGAPPAEPIPDGLDWDLWLGPAAQRPFNRLYAPVKWRSFWDFGTGGLGDIGCHTFDAPFWALGLGLPTRIEADVEGPDDYRIPRANHVTFHFPANDKRPAVTMQWLEKTRAPELRPDFWDTKRPIDKGGGLLMFGSKATLYCPGMRPGSPQITPGAKFRQLKPTLPGPTDPLVPKHDHVKEWIHAIKHGTQPGSNFEYAAPLTEMVLTGLLPARAGVKRIDYDPANMRVTNHDHANRFLRPHMRDGWTYGTA